MSRSSTLEELESELVTALTTYQQLMHSRGRRKRLLAEYNLGKAAGIISTLRAFGKEDIVTRNLKRSEQKTQHRVRGFERRMMHSMPR